MSHYLAIMGHEVSEIKMPFVPRWFLKITPSVKHFWKPMEEEEEKSGEKAENCIFLYKNTGFWPQKEWVCKFEK